MHSGKIQEKIQEKEALKRPKTENSKTLTHPKKSIPLKAQNFAGLRSMTG